ncbi:MAG: ABC transporter ATP-binding protein, partial [Bacillota bacterium]|nr:ABC transporter ATP-binding protein [Bacillota bacterium]
SEKKSEMTLGKMLLKAWQPFFLLIISQIILQFFAIFMSLMIRDLFDAAVAGDSALLVAKAPLFIALSIGLLPFNIWLSYVRALFIRKADAITKQRYLKRVFAKNINEFQSSGISRYINDITNNTNTLEERYYRQITIVVMSVTNFLGSLIIIISINWESLAFILPIIALIFFLMYKTGGFLKKPEAEKAEYLEEYTRYAKESLAAFRIVKSFQLEQRIINDFDQRSKNVQDKSHEIERRATYLQAMNQLFTSAIALFGMLIGIRAVSKGYISIGVLLITIVAISNMIHPIFMLSEALPHIRSVEPIFKKMEEHLKNRHEQKINQPYQGLAQQIELSELSFDYPDIPVLKNASALFKKGGKYLIVGPSGSGKSTILRLLRKYFNPDQGQILLDQTSLSEIETESYYHKLANIEQNVFIFDDTIRNNITLYHEIPEEEFNQAIQAAGLENLLASRENGAEDILVNNGAELSGGEKARIAIARGLLSEAEIILLDEPFASLDDETAQKIEQSLFALPEVTVINVSHIIFEDTKHLYDKIYLVKDGQIIVKPDKTNV